MHQSSGLTAEHPDMPQTPSKSPRRVLVDLTTNASLTPSKLRSAEALFTNTLLKNRSPRQDSKQKDLLSPRMGLEVFRAGQKRSIDQVEGSEEQQDTKPDSRLSTSFHASQEPPVLREDEFHIEEEMSQTVVDQLHTLSQPALAPVELRHVAQNEGGKDSQESTGMSSLIDFDPNEEELAPTLPTDPEARKAAVTEKAENLRYRLQLAMYKIQTNQADTPFSKLRSPDPSPRSPSLPPNQPSTEMMDTTSVTEPPPLPTTSLQLGNAPKLIPTAYSVRYVSEPEQSARHFLSSPPVSAGNDKTESRNQRPSSPTPTPAQTRPKTPSTPMQLSSPPRTEGGESVSESRLVGKGIMTLTSSVVKGEAANGLLELMKGGL